MKPRWTPGPWRVDGQFDAEVDVDIVSDSEDLLICSIEPVMEVWTASEVANVRLMAAAPELYDELTEMRGTCAACLRVIYACDATKLLLAEFERARVRPGFGIRANAALAKARGEK